MTPARKLGIACAALVAGEALGLSSGGCAALWPVLGWVALFVAVFGFARRVCAWPVAFFLLLGLTLAMRAVDARHAALTDIALGNGPYEAVFTVGDEARSGATDEEGMRWVSFRTTYPGGRLKVVFRQSAADAPPRAGERWRCSGWLSRPGRDGGRCASLWVRGPGTCAVRERATGFHALGALLAGLRRNLSRRLGIGLEDRPILADLHRAMLLGERSSLPQEWRTTFVQAGTVHVFAISGLHVMVVANFLLFVLAMTLLPIRWAGAALLPFLWLYVAMIGSPPSAIRAAAMASVYFAAPVFWRRPDGLAAWQVTLIAFAILDPSGLFAIGSLLSFAVVLAILLALRWARPFGSRLVTSLVVPFSAWAAGVPIVAHGFGSIAIGGLAANLVMVPLAGAAVLAEALGLAASFVSRTLAAHINNLAALFTEAMMGVSWAVSRIPGASLEIAPWPIWVCVAWYVGFGLLFVWIRMVWARRRAALA